MAKRRIVPELISPSQASTVQAEFVAAVEQPPDLRLNLKEQADVAKGLLGPGRKVYVDISAEPKVNWRKVCAFYSPTLLYQLQQLANGMFLLRQIILISLQHSTAPTADAAAKELGGVTQQASAAGPPA